jgi:hypothetical protein
VSANTELEGSYAASANDINGVISDTQAALVVPEKCTFQ